MRFILRAAGFLLGLWLLIYTANTFFIQTDSLAYLSLHELTHRDNVELAIVGSSVALNHFDPKIIQEKTGLITYNASSFYMSLQGCNALAKLVFDHHDPKYTILIAEPFFFEKTTESTQTQFRLMPFIKNPIDRATYYLDLCSQDDLWLDRLFLPRIHGVESFDQFTKTLRHHLDPQQALRDLMDSTSYQGGGFLDRGDSISEAERMRISSYHSNVRGADALPEYSKKAILRFAKLCKQNGSQLMIVTFPFITSSMFAEPSFSDYNELLAEFCRENDIPCYDLTLAKEEFLPPLDAYYQNAEHMGIDGAVIVTDALIEIFNRHYAGEDISALFYKDYDEFFSTIDYVVNTWLEPDAENGGYIAKSNHLDSILPEYRFTAIASDGSETLLRDYSADPKYTLPLPEGTYLRVYARAQGTEHTPVYFDRN